MILETLLTGLEHASPAVRLDVIRVLGMVEETQALDRLRALYPTEPDETVRRAMSWAGSRIHQAERAGYSTVDALFQHFGVDRVIQSIPDAAEAELLRKLQDQFDRDLLDMQSQQNKRRLGTALAAGLGGAMLGGAAVGMMAAAGTMMGGTDALSSGLGGGQAAGTSRAPATRPCDTNIAVWARRLRETTSAEQRARAALELAHLNNPRALPALALAFVADESASVRETAQLCGKVLYWSVVYWEMEQSGALAAEMERRAQRLGRSLPHEAILPPAPAAPPAGPAPLDIEEILRKAQQEREERKHRGL